MFEVTGGTKPYEVHLGFEDVSPKTVQALKNALRNNQIKLSCDCFDYKFRFSYWATRHNFSMDNEHRPAKIRNPKDNLGPSCKHVAAVLKNLNWTYALIADMKKNSKDDKDNKEDEDK